MFQGEKPLVQLHHQKHSSSGKNCPEIGVMFTQGGQLNYNIWCILRDLLDGDCNKVQTLFFSNSWNLKKIEKLKGIIIGGGPLSVYEDTEEVKKSIEFIQKQCHIPILGICFGHQLLCQAFGGRVGLSGSGEYSSTEIEVIVDDPIFQNIPQNFTAWSSHQDEVIEIPKNFITLASSKNCNIEAMRHKNRSIYGVQFHPEVVETNYGVEVFHNFLKESCGIDIVSHPRLANQIIHKKLRSVFESKGNHPKKREIPPRQISNFQKASNRKGKVKQYRFLFPPSPVIRTAEFVKNAIKYVKSIVRNQKVLLALSGGIDSSIVSEIISKAIGDKLWAVHINQGFMRTGECDEVVATFEDRIPNLIYLDASKNFLNSVKGYNDSEEKRDRFSSTYFDILETLSHEIGAGFTSQGTIYPDLIEGERDEKSVSYIKNQHNVNPPKGMRIKGLIEPLAGCFKNELRVISAYLNLPNVITFRMPFPGPGLLVRIVGEVNEEMLEILKKSNSIIEQRITQECISKYHIPIFIREDGLHIPWQTFAFIIRNQSFKDHRIQRAEKIVNDILNGHSYKLIECKFLEDKMTGVKGDQRTYSNPIVIRLSNEDGAPWADYVTSQKIFLALTSKPELNITRVLLDVSNVWCTNQAYYIGIRAVESVNALTAKCMDLDFDTIENIVRDLRKIVGIHGVLFDIGNKPCETIEPE